MQQLNLFDKKATDKEEPVKKTAPKPVENANEKLLQQQTTDNTEAVEARKKFQKITPEKPPSKRGRKSFKDIDIDVALLDIPDDEILFQKQYYSISEVAEWFHVNNSLIRYWEREFDILKPRKNRKGDRLFRPEDVKNMRIIYYLLRQQKYSMEGAKQFLKDNKLKAEMQTQLVETLSKFRLFLLELKASLNT